MGNLYIVLADHGVLHCGVNFGMSEELLHLFDGHSFIDGAGSKRSSELMRVHFGYAELSPEFPQSYLDAADL